MVGGLAPGNDINLSRQYIIDAVERTLKRQRTDHIDPSQSHTDDFGTPMEDTLDTKTRGGCTILTALDSVSRSLGVTSAQVALA